MFSESLIQFTSSQLSSMYVTRSRIFFYKFEILQLSQITSASISQSLTLSVMSYSNPNVLQTLFIYVSILYVFITPLNILYNNQQFVKHNPLLCSCPVRDNPILQALTLSFALFNRYDILPKDKTSSSNRDI